VRKFSPSRDNSRHAIFLVRKWPVSTGAAIAIRTKLHVTAVDYFMKSAPASAMLTDPAMVWFLR
jgi:hypothetical protein